MTTTIVGQVTDSLGCSAHLDVWADPNNPRRAFYQREFLAAPASEYCDRQPATIGFDWNHADRLGEVRYLERRNGGITMVATSDIDVIATFDEPLYLSPSIGYLAQRGGNAVNATNVEIRSIALTPSPATVGLNSVKLIPGDLAAARDYAACRRELRGAAEIIGRARQYCRDRRPGDAHVIADEPRPAALEQHRFATAPTAVTTSTITAERGMLKIVTPTHRHGGQRPKLVWKWWHGNPGNWEPVGSHVATDNGVIWFRPTRTRAGREAFALIDDGLIDSVRPLLKLDGTTSSFELVAA